MDLREKYMKKPKPDFTRVRKGLFLYGEPDRVPKVELWIDHGIVSKFLGRKAKNWFLLAEF